jgi:Mg2+-importing ATPase
VFSILVASAWLPFQPMRPIQLLTQNLLFDLSQAAIPFDRMDPSERTEGGLCWWLCWLAVSMV